VKTVRERAQERREEKLEMIRLQVASGSLVIRSMSAEERLRYPPVAGPARVARFTRSRTP
jgi:hypothetical protein